ncbi:hypothetical protein Hdeb2414_s0014g00434121 [Helianthus debilis subsp. tardiflorus]
MSVQQQHQKVQEVGDYVAVPAPVVVVSDVPASNAPAAAEYLNQQQKQSAGFDLASMDSVSSDGRQKPAMIYQDQLLNIQSSNNNRASDLSNNVSDQNVRIQMQQQQIPDSAYVMSMSNPQGEKPVLAVATRWPETTRLDLLSLSLSYVCVYCEIKLMGARVLKKMKKMPG